MKSLIVALLCLFACVCAADNFEDCGSQSAKVKAVRINGKEGCDLDTNSANTFHIDFESTEDTPKDILATATGIFTSGKILYFHLSNEYGCENNGLQCPLEKGKSYTYNNSISLGDAQKKLDVKWELEDDDDKNIFCVKVGPCQTV